MEKPASSLGAGPIAGGVIGGIVLVLVILIAVVALIKYMQRGKFPLHMFCCIGASI